MSVICELSNISHGYGERDVLRGVDCSVQAGDFFVIVGPNGSGKTTLLRLMAGLERPASGEIRLGGRELAAWRVRERARCLAYVPQHVSDDIPFSVAETVLLGRSARQSFLGMGSPEDNAVAGEAMRLAGVSHLSGRPVKALSGGERQRTFIARALAQEPEIILLDEPTSALDYAHQIQVMDMLARLRRERGVTVVMISHDLNLASMYATTAFLLKEGQAVAAGCPATLFTAPLLSDVYGCPMRVDVDSRTGRPRILPEPGAEAFRGHCGS